MKIFTHLSYTEALTEVIELRKQLGLPISLSALAQTCQMQPSYVTNVLKGRADFNTDQLARICDQLEIGIEEGDYLALLLELKKTNFDKRRLQLETKIKELRARHLRAEKSITTKSVELLPDQLNKYYLDPFIQLIHIFLGSYKKHVTVDLLAQKFSLPKNHVANILQTLEEIHYIKRIGNQIKVLVEGRHLPRESALLKPHHALMRIKSIDQMQRLSSDQSYSFSATISTEPEVKTLIQAEFLKFLKVAEKLVRSRDSEKLYQINFDLFPWEID